MDNDTTPSETEAVDEFARAFEEFSSGDPVSAPDIDAAEEEDTQEAEESQDESTDQDGSEAEQSPAEEQPAAEEAAEAQEPNEQQTEPSDELKRLQEENKRLNDRFASENGRHRAAMQRVNDLERKLEQQQAKQPAQTSQGMTEFREAFPEIADFMDRQAETIGQLQGQVTDLSTSHQDVVTTATSKAIDELSKEHPDWSELVTSRQADIQAFLESPGITRQALLDFNANSENIRDAVAASRFLTGFKKFLGIETAPNPKPDPDPQPDPQQGQTDAGQEDEKQVGVSARRARQLRGAQSPRTSSPAVNLQASQGDNFSDGWKLGGGG